MGCVLFFQGCSKDSTIHQEDGEQVEQVLLTYEFIVPYIESTIVSTSGVFVIDDTGSILGGQEYDHTAEQTISVTFMGDPDARYHVNKYDRIEDYDEYHFGTYLDISPGQYYLGEHSEFAESHNVVLNIENAAVGNDPIPNDIVYTNFHGGYSVQNGLIVNGIVSNEEAFYISFKKANEEYPRYHFIESVTSDIEENIDYNELPFAYDVMNITIPENNHADFRFVGTIGTNTSMIRREYFTEGASSYSWGLSGSVFDRMRTDVSYRNGSRGYTYVYNGSTLNHDITIPDFDFNIDEYSVTNTKISTSGNYSGYLSHYYNLNYETTIDFDYWIVGKASEIIEIDVSPYLANFIEPLPFSINDMVLNIVTLYKDSDIQSNQSLPEDLINGPEYENESLVETTSWYRAYE